MKKADFAVIAVVVLLAGILLFVLYGLPHGSGSFVRVEIDGKVVETVSLYEDFEKEYTAYGGGKNTLVISGGKASVTQADCPDGICTRHNAISRSGESIICLPHRFTVTVSDTAGDAQIDAVA